MPKYFISYVFTGGEGPAGIPAGDIEQLVADTESKIDDSGDGQYDARYLVEDLMYRLTALAGLDMTGYPAPAPVYTMTIGRNDRCLITTPHTARLCGKPEAH